MRSFNLLPGEERIANSALNRCCGCDHQWRDLPFGHARHDNCPKCGSVYWRWLDFERSD